MAETKVTHKQIEKIAQLCNLDLSQEEISKLSNVLTDTLDYINVLEELDTSRVKETFQVTGLKNVFMKGNENKKTLSKKEVLSNAKEVINDLFVTKAVFDRN